MSMLAALVQRGGRPAAVAPTIPLRVGEKQYGWFPVSVDGAGRRVAVITNQRLIVGDEEFALRSISRVHPEPADWSVALEVRGRVGTLVLSGPWVPWLSVVICAELYATAWPPGHAMVTTVPAPRRGRVTAALCPSGDAARG
ncbi:hypothetical protein ACWKSP_05705 [Micromonosporaceae bacterium Da 78-11]